MPWGPERWDEASLHACAGILDLKQAQEWVVTTKLGASDKRPGTQVVLALCL